MAKKVWDNRPADGVPVKIESPIGAPLTAPVKAGTPTDADIPGGAADGDIVIDSTASKIWVRIGGTWKATVALT